MRKRATAKSCISDNKLRKEIERTDRRMAAAHAATQPGHAVAGKGGNMLPVRLTRKDNMGGKKSKPKASKK